MDSKLFYQALKRYGKLYTPKLLIMKLTAVLILAFTFNLSAKSFSQKITIAEKNISLEKVFSLIEKQTGYSFLYEKKALKKAGPVSLNIQNMELTEALKLCFREQPFVYEMKYTTIIVREKEMPAAPAVSADISMPPPPVTIQGNVQNEEGSPLAGASVKLKGAERGTSTDADGNFTLQLPDAAGILVISYIGHESVEIPVSEETFLRVVLKLAETRAEEIVVVGYGTQKKSDLTGAISSLRTSDYESQPLAGIQELFQGRSAGVNVNANSGAPGATLKVRIRGANSINAGNEPLYIVDGMALTSASIRDLNVNDIKSIEILKDASSTAIYGSRGANGVVIINTRQGRSGKTVVGYNGFVSFNSAPDKYKLLDAQSYARQANYIAGAEVFKDIDALQTTDWQGLIFRPTTVQNHQVSVEGGGENSRYFLSLGYLDQPGIVINTQFKRYALRANVSSTINKKTQVFLNMFLSRSEGRNNGDLGKSAPVSGSVAWGPAESPFLDNGEYRRNSVSSIWLNPYMLIKEQLNDNYVNTGLINAGLKYDFTSWLSFQANVGLDANTSRTAFLNNNRISPNNPGSGQESGESYTFQNSNILTFQKKFKNDHFLKVLGIMEATSNATRGFLARGSGLTTMANGYDNLGLNTSKDIGSTFSDWSLLSYIGRMEYNYQSKYYFNASIRADGSSKFIRKWGYFPSVGVAYNIANESFMQDNELVSDLKLRASWGVAGNQNVPPYTSRGILSGVQYSFGMPVLYQGYTIGSPAVDLTWERTDQTNVGVDLSLFHQKLNFSVDYYKKVTRDLLLQVPVPLYNGGGTIFQNTGTVQNSGFEFSVESALVENKNFSWRANFNLSFNQNKVLNLGKDSLIYRPIIGGGIVNTNIQVVKVGEPLSSFYLIPWEGIYQSHDDVLGYKAGDNKYRDVNGNNSIGYEDRVISGFATPSFVYGFNNTFNYRNIELNVFIQGAGGNKIFNGIYAANAAPTSEIKYPTLVESSNYWRPDNTGATWADPASKTNRNFVESTRYLQDGGYLRLKNISLSYAVAKKIPGISGIKLALSAQNILTLTKYKGYDPEASSSSSLSDADAGMDFGAYPLFRSYTIGLNVTF